MNSTSLNTAADQSLAVSCEPPLKNHAEIICFNIIYFYTAAYFIIVLQAAVCLIKKCVVSTAIRRLFKYVITFPAGKSNNTESFARNHLLYHFLVKLPCSAFNIFQNDLLFFLY